MINKIQLVDFFKQNIHVLSLVVIASVLRFWQLDAEVIVFAFFGVLAVIGVYELSTVALSRAHGLVATTIVAASPIMVAQSRMSHPGVVIPFLTILFLAGCMVLWHKLRGAPFWAVLTLGLLVIFQLTAAPLVIVPIYIWLKKYHRMPTISEATQVILAGSISIAGYAFLNAQNLLIEQVELNILSSFWLSSTHIFSQDILLISIIVWLVILLGVIRAIRLAQKQKLPAFWELVLVAIFTLGVSTLIWRDSTTTQYAPFFILIPMHLSCLVLSLSNKWRRVGWGLLTGLLLINAVHIWQFYF